LSQEKGSCIDALKKFVFLPYVYIKFNLTLAMDSFESTVLKKYRRLSQFLIVSSLLNVAFISSAIYQYFKPVKPIEWTSLKGNLHENSENVLKSFLNLSYQDLVSKLNLKQMVEPGLLKRDLALAILAHSYHVDLARALNKPHIQEQILSYHEAGKQKALGIPRGLTDVDFEIISQFLKQETWPLTARGLFMKLKLGVKDESLLQAFFTSSEFSRLFDVAKLSFPQLKKEALLSVLLKGDVAEFEASEKSCLDGRFIIEQFLTNYLNNGSAIAALYLIELPNFSIKNLSDKQALELIDLLHVNPEKQKVLALDLLSSFRGESFKNEIEKRGFIKEQKESDFIAAEVKVKKEEKVQPKSSNAPKLKPYKTYVVQEGDSLWKISRKFKVDVDVLKAHNRLESENLKPGKVLEIP
jgi:LysM domain